MRRTLLDIIGITIAKNGNKSGIHALMLGSRKDEWHFPIIIGGLEAQSIAMQMERIHPSRPMTYDLFINFTKAYDIEIKEVLIYNLVEGVFYAKLICEDRAGQITEIESRVSDAVTLSIKLKCPVYIESDILKTPGLIVEGPLPTPEANSPKQQLDVLSELNKLLQEAIEKEDYEQASLLRDEIKRRKDDEQ